MLRIKKILYATDFSECANQALPQALFLAKKYNAKLDILHAIYLHGDHDPYNPIYHFPDIEPYYTGIAKVATEKSGAILKSHNAGKVDVAQVTRRGIAPAPIILEYAREQDIDLIIMGTHGRRGLGHLFMGSVAEEVVRLSGCPVLTIREHKKSASIETKKRILVPVDFSKHSENALLYAKYIAATYKSRLQLLHVVEDSVHPSFYATGTTSIFDIMPQIQSTTKKYLKKMFNETGGPDVPFDIKIVEGRAAKDIIKFAEDKRNDMIVIATHGLTGIQHFLMGSVAEKVVRMARCPVFTVKAFGKSLLEK